MWEINNFQYNMKNLFCYSFALAWLLWLLGNINGKHYISVAIQSLWKRFHITLCEQLFSITFLHEQKQSPQKKIVSHPFLKDTDSNVEHWNEFVRQLRDSRSTAVINTAYASFAIYTNAISYISVGLRAFAIEPHETCVWDYL